MAPFSRIHATATDVSSPPEKASPTRSPTGSSISTRAAGHRSSSSGLDRLARPRSVLARRAPPTRSDATHSMVSSPATVPSEAGQPRAVEGRGHHVGAARRRAHDDEVARVRDLGHPLAQHPAEVVVGGEAVGLVLGDGVGELAAGQAHLDGAEVVEVAADGGLGGGDAGVGQQLDELGLAGDLVLGQEPGDPVLAL